MKSVLLGREFFTDFRKKLKCLKEKKNTFQSTGFSQPIQLYFLFNFQKISYYCIVISFLSIACLYLPFLFFFILLLYTHISIHFYCTYIYIMYMDGTCIYIHSILFWSKYYAFFKVHFNFQFFHIAFSWFSSTFQFKLQSSFPRHLKSCHPKIADQFHPDIPEILIKYPQCIKHYVKCFNYRNNQGENDSSYHGVILNLRLMACFLCRIFLKNDILLIYPIHIYYILLYIRIKSNSYFVSSVIVHRYNMNHRYPQKAGELKRKNTQG